MAETKTDYWREASAGLEIIDYPEVEEGDVTFPETIYVAFAVCHKGCGRREFIVEIKSLEWCKLGVSPACCSKVSWSGRKRHSLF